MNVSTLVETFGVIIPDRWTGSPQAKSIVSMPRRTSARASGNVLPWSRVMRRASSSRFSNMSCRNWKKMLLRAMSGMSRHAGKAAAAAATAASTSGLTAARAHAR